MTGGFWALFLGQPRARADHVQALDGLRGLAVLIVVGSHLSNAGWLPQPGLSGTGKSGVYLFFVLSAYLLTHAVLLRPLAGLASAGYWINYALRRVLRIWPLYLAILLLSWALTCVGIRGWHYQIDTAALWGHLTLREGISVLWSIPVEFTFYLWLPFIAVTLAALRDVRGGRWLGLALLAGLVLLARWCWPAAEAVTNSVGLGSYLVVFLCGVAAAWMQAQWPDQGRWQGAWRGLAWLLLLLLVLAVPSLWARWHGAPFDAGVNHRWFTAFGLGWALLLLAVLRGRGIVCRVFASAPLRLVGVVSFSAYLWHMPVLDAAAAVGMKAWGWPAVLVLLPAVLLVAMASFLLFERPWRDVRYNGRFRQAAESGTAPAA